MFEELSRFVEVEAQCGGINLQQLVLRAQSRQWKRAVVPVVWTDFPRR
jgi:hypothetical protein